MNQEKLPIRVTSEYGALKTVIVHRPGLEIDTLTPENRSVLLFEDIPFLKKMVEEHDEFVKVMTGENIRVLYLGDLLKDIIKSDSGSKERILYKSCVLQKSLAPIILNNYDDDEILKLIFGGLTVSELLNDTGIDLTAIKTGEDPFLLDPIPNAYFTRDPAAVVGEKIVSCKMHFEARVRETLLFQEIFNHHKFFKPKDLHEEDIMPTNFLFGHGVSEEEEKPYCVEGGDIIVLSEKAVAIGASQRTRVETINKLAVNLFQKTKVQRVYQINIPAERAYMHLDTVFTVVDRGVVVAYPNVMREIKEIIRYEPHHMANSSKVIAIPIVENRSFNKLLEDEFGKLKVINTGANNYRYASREQLADGTNVFAIAPGKVITYNRNTHTNDALRSAGVTVIEIEGSELVRGLGGPRCMTMPIYRENI